MNARLIYKAGGVPILEPVTLSDDTTEDQAIAWGNAQVDTFNRDNPNEPFRQFVRVESDNGFADEEVTAKPVKKTKK